VEGSKTILDAAKESETCPVVVFSSSVATGGDGLVQDDKVLTPLNTYGMTKVVVEYLMNDYTRRGWVDGRSARLPSVIVRPGVPNKASTGVFSGVVREPFNGQTCVVPFDRFLPHPVLGTRAIVNGLITLLSPVMGPKDQRGFTFPAITTTIDEIQKASERVADKYGIPLGQVIDDVDPALNKVVNSMPKWCVGTNAEKVGVRRSESLDAIIEEYCEDELGMEIADPTRTIGFIGLGNMGASMARNLAQKTDHKIVVYNRSVEKSKALQEELPQIEIASSASELAERCKSIHVCLQNESISNPLILDEVLPNCRRGVVVIDHGTVSPESTDLCFSKAMEMGVDFLDAPISGGPEGARDGTISIMVGGTQDAFDTVHTSLRAMGGYVVRMGESGTGTISKTINQQLVGSHSMAAAEAYLIGSGKNVDMDQLNKLLEKSWGYSKIQNRCFSVIQKGGDALHNSGAPLRNLAKDIAISKKLATELGLELPILNETDKVCQTAMKLNKGGADMAIMKDIIDNVSPRPATGSVLDFAHPAKGNDNYEEKI